MYKSLKHVFVCFLNKHIILQSLQSGKRPGFGEIHRKLHFRQVKHMVFNKLFNKWWPLERFGQFIFMF